MQISDILIYDIKDEMDGTYSLIKTTGKKKNDYIKFYIHYCKVCGDEIVTYYRYRNSNHKTFGVCEKKVKNTNGKLNVSICKLKYIQSLEKPIEYNGKLYTLDDVPDYIKNIYQNPIKRFVNKTKWEDEHKKPLKGKPTPNWILLEISKEEYEKARKIRWIELKGKDYFSKLARNAYKRKPMLIRIRNLMRTMARQAINQEIVTKAKDMVDCEAGTKYLREQAIIIMKKYCYNNISEVFKNYEVDHIIPKSIYDFQNDPIEFANANYHLNLRLITKFENRSKGDRIRPEDIELIKTLPKEIYPKSWNGIIPEGR